MFQESSYFKNGRGYMRTYILWQQKKLLIESILHTKIMKQKNLQNFNNKDNWLKFKNLV